MRPPALAALLLTLLTVVPGLAQAHGVGGSPIAISDSFTMTAAGTLGDTFHAYLADMGIPGHAGETLRYNWTANNGLGPAVYFEIHDHAPPAGYRIYFSTTNLTEQGEWAIPGSEDYMVFWQNVAGEAIEVQYSFSLLAAPPDYLPTIIIVAAAGGFLAALWFIWRGKGGAPEEE